MTRNWDLRAAVEKIVNRAPSSEGYRGGDTPVIGVDEDLQHPEIEELCRNLVSGGYAQMTRPLWHEMREDEEGQKIVVSGSPPAGQGDLIDLGHPIKHWRCEDRKVAGMAVVHLNIYRRFLLLSGNKRWDDEGLRQILHEEVEPALNESAGHDLGLYFLLRGGKTGIREYARQVLTFCIESDLKEGFHEKVI